MCQSQCIKARRQLYESLITIDSGRIIYRPIGNSDIDVYDYKAVEDLERLEDQKVISVIT